MQGVLGAERCQGLVFVWRGQLGLLLLPCLLHLTTVLSVINFFAGLPEGPLPELLHGVSVPLDLVAVAGRGATGGHPCCLRPRQQSAADEATPRHLFVHVGGLGLPHPNGRLEVVGFLRPRAMSSPSSDWGLYFTLAAESSSSMVSSALFLLEVLLAGGGGGRAGGEGFLLPKSTAT